nr:hypothetical protein CFP56_22224 [Quercus suber]
MSYYTDRFLHRRLPALGRPCLLLSEKRDDRKASARLEGILYGVVQRRAAVGSAVKQGECVCRGTWPTARRNRERKGYSQDVDMQQGGLNVAADRGGRSAASPIGSRGAAVNVRRDVTGSRLLQLESRLSRTESTISTRSGSLTPWCLYLLTRKSSLLSHRRLSQPARSNTSLPLEGGIFAHGLTPGATMLKSTVLPHQTRGRLLTLSRGIAEYDFGGFETSVLETSVLWTPTWLRLDFGSTVDRTSKRRPSCRALCHGELLRLRQSPSMRNMACDDSRRVSLVVMHFARAHTTWVEPLATVKTSMLLISKIQLSFRTHHRSTPAGSCLVAWSLCPAKAICNCSSLSVLPM